MATVPRLRNPGLDKQGENANGFTKGLDRTNNSFREPGMYLTLVADVIRTAAPSHDMLELLSSSSSVLDLATQWSVDPTWPFVSEKTLSKTKLIRYFTQRNFCFNCPSSHQENVMGILELGRV